jgi:alpha-N-arabinofuranosidase
VPLAAVHAAEIHVAINGKDTDPGTKTAPLRTIQRAADLAQPGDTITVHEGTYRERVNPPRGGESETKRIVYQAAPGEKVEIKGSEVVKNWEKVADDAWKVTLPNSFFGSFNPYSDVLHGDWYMSMGRQVHSGAVYLDGRWLTEAATLDEVLKPAGTSPLWFAQVDPVETTIWAQFKEADPNERLVEINVRRTVFYPAKAGINYITVRGFTMRQAATPWAPPTAEQIAIMGTHWSKGWIIEDNHVSHSACCGISLGKYGDEWDNRAASAKGYVGTIERALAHGWSQENIGHHVVRNNTISDCEQAGIVGSLGAAFSTITGNTIHDIYIHRLFDGAEIAGIKLHAAIDVQISRNHIYRTRRGLWLDWMAQGTRISRNLFHDNTMEEDVFFEVDHGPILVENNIFLSPISLHSRSQGAAFAHNLFAGALNVFPFDGRKTPFHKPHSTEVAGLHDNPCGDDRYYNNIFVGRPDLSWYPTRKLAGLSLEEFAQRADLSAYDSARLPVWMDGNVFLRGSKPCRQESAPLVEPEFDPGIKLCEKKDGWYLEFTFDAAWAEARARKLVSTDLLGKALIPNAAYEEPDGTPIAITTDYFGKSRSRSNPTPGPFESPGQGALRLRVR